jgi:predicted phosphodiesterase
MSASLKYGLKWIYWLLLLIVFTSPVFAQRIVVISDINGRYGSTEYHPRVAKAIQVIIDLKPDLVIGAGDMVAGQKQPLLDQSRLDLMWASFNQVVADPLKEAGIELIISPGNHDGSALPGFVLEQERFKAHWLDRPPRLELLDGSDWPRRYALWLEKTLIISIDGTRPGRIQDADLHLLENTLQEKASAADSIIVVSHLPMWPLSRGRESEIIIDTALTGLLARYEVDFFISGHHHVFYTGTDDNVTNHVAVGALGGNARKFVGQSDREPFSFVVIDNCADHYRVSARAAPSFRQEVPLSSLPDKIRGGSGYLHRFDLSKPQTGNPCVGTEQLP